MRKVLSEEEYMKRLGSIIKRDFFPNVQESLGDGLEGGINDFQTQYTTEDDASFEELLERENRRKRERFERVHGGPALLRDNPDRRLLLRASECDEAKVKLCLPKVPLFSIEGGSSPVEGSATINLHNTRFSGEDSGWSCEESGEIFTFGEVGATPLRLDESVRSGSFRIPATPLREQLAHSLTATNPVSSASKSRRSKESRAKATPSYRLEDLKGLTPKRNK